MSYGNRNQGKLKFVSSGNHFVFSDNPESFTLAAGYLKYLWGCGVGTEFKDVEMYHHLWNGYSGTGAISFGVAVQNTTGAPVTITYRYHADFADTGKKTNKPSEGAIASGDAIACTIVPKVLTGYLNKSTITKTVAAGSSAVIMASDTSFVKDCAKFIAFRGQLKASVSNGVYLRIFVSGSSSTSSGLATKLFAIPNYESGFEKHFCGELGYTQVSAAIDASDTGTYYKVFAHPSGYNPGEYGSVVAHKPDGLNQLDGNYGVQYHLTLNNANGKKIWIEPDWTVEKRTDATIVYRFNDGSWVARDTPIKMNGCWTLAIPQTSSGTATVDLIMPGGNFGNYFVYFS